MFHPRNKACAPPGTRFHCVESPNAGAGARKQNKKGSVLTTASLAGIQAAKQCSQLIPLCHNIPLSQADVSFTWHPNGLEATAVVSCIGPTGVEMEALTAVSLALLTIYDMCKAVDKEMEITNIRLIEKTKTKTD